jgi:hypothetical protein
MLVAQFLHNNCTTILMCRTFLFLKKINAGHINIVMQLLYKSYANNIYIYIYIYIYEIC